MAFRIQIRRDTAANWASVDPILAEGELGIDLDEDKFKIGDGVTVWSGLSFIAGPTEPSAFEFIFDGGGAIIPANSKVWIEVPFDCVILRSTALADVSTTTVFGVWKDTYANFPPTVADVITGAAPPTITAALKSQDSTLTGWTTAVAAGSIILVNINSNNNATKLNLSLKIIKV